MITTGQLALGAAEVVSTTCEPICYVYTVATPTGQLQRWLLHKDPQNAFKIRRPPSHMAGWSLSDWQANVPKEWRKGSIYVRAESVVYRHGETYDGVVWTKIPADLPPPIFPKGSGESHQLDPIGSRIIHVMQEDRRGLAFTVRGVHAESNAEYWLLPGAYEPAGGSAEAGIVMGSEEVSDLDQFVRLANQSFQPGSLFIITGCVNYAGDAPPAFT